MANADKQNTMSPIQPDPETQPPVFKAPPVEYVILSNQVLIMHSLNLLLSCGPHHLKQSASKMLEDAGAATEQMANAIIGYVPKAEESSVAEPTQ